MKRISVLTWNLNSRTNDLTVNKQIELIKNHMPDIVTLQEITINSLEKIINRLKSVIEVDIFGYIPIKDVSHLEFLHVNRFVPKSELNLAYKKADICVIPSLFDNSPNTVYEAMASGKIVVASAVGGIPEIMGESENGYLFKKSDVDDLTLKLSQAIDLVLAGNDTILRKNAQKRIISIANLQENVLQRIKLIK